jgi:hypothetical protein
VPTPVAWQRALRFGRSTNRPTGVANFRDVTDEQWATADAIVGACPGPSPSTSWASARFVKLGFGYDDLDLERFRKIGITACKTPDYGTGGRRLRHCSDDGRPENLAKPKRAQS